MPIATLFLSRYNPRAAPLPREALSRLLRDGAALTRHVSEHLAVQLRELAAENVGTRRHSAAGAGPGPSAAARSPAPRHRRKERRRRRGAGAAGRAAPCSRGVLGNGVLRARVRGAGHGSALPRGALGTERRWSGDGVSQRSRWYFIFVVAFVFTDVLRQQAHRKDGAALLVLRRCVRAQALQAQHFPTAAEKHRGKSKTLDSSSC